MLLPAGKYLFEPVRVFFLALKKPKEWANKHKQTLIWLSEPNIQLICRKFAGQKTHETLFTFNTACVSTPKINLEPHFLSIKNVKTNFAGQKEHVDVILCVFAIQKKDLKYNIRY